MLMDRFRDIAGTVDLLDTATVAARLGIALADRKLDHPGRDEFDGPGGGVVRAVLLTQFPRSTNDVAWLALHFVIGTPREEIAPLEPLMVRENLVSHVLDVPFEGAAELDFCRWRVGRHLFSLTTRVEDDGSRLLLGASLGQFRDDQRCIP